MKTDAPAIARLELTRVCPNGERIPIAVEIGAPYQAEAGEWSTPVAIHGLHGRLGDICGEDSFQSLCLAMDLIRRLLSSAIEKGDRLLDGDCGFQTVMKAYFPEH